MVWPESRHFSQARSRLATSVQRLLLGGQSAVLLLSDSKSHLRVTCGNL
jgi:hypothetical protein